MSLGGVETTRDVKIPSDSLECVIGQDAAVEKVKLAIKQRRHLLLVGPPGVGKSMIAQAMAAELPEPQIQLNVLPNPTNSQKPVIEVLARKEVLAGQKKLASSLGVIASPEEVPAGVSEQLGLRCRWCGTLSHYSESACPACGANKRLVGQGKKRSPFGDVITDVFEISGGQPAARVKSVRNTEDGVEEVVYERLPDGRVRILDEKALASVKKQVASGKAHTIVPLERNTFVRATGASETELLGDVRHDPYGSHPQIGTPPHLRVVAGAIHEAHEGVLFIDELPQIAPLQKFILTAMQDKKFPISGRNPQSAGASVKVADVPCDFLFVGACNIGEVGNILPPLRSRIKGSGYEILLETTMPDSEENRAKILQFIAQEILWDGRIPHATAAATEEVIEECKRVAAQVDDAKNALSLRLRELGGLVRLAGDYAVNEGAELIEIEHIKRSIVESRSIERQLEDRYGSVWRGMDKDKFVGSDGGAPGYG